MTARGGRVLAALVATAVLAACAGAGDDAEDPGGAPDDATCAATAAQVVRTTERYVDAFSAETAESAGAPADDVLSDEEFASAVADLRTFAGAAGCDAEEFERDVEAGLSTLEADSPLGTAVLLQLRAGTVGGPPRSVAVAPGVDLREVAASLPSASRIELAAGEHRLDGPLVLLRGITLRGASRDTTVLATDSPDGVLLVLTGEATVVEHLELRRTGDAPGSVVTVGPVARTSLTSVRVTGGRAEEDGSGGAGVVLAPAPDGAAGPTPAAGDAVLQRPTTLRVVDSELVGNQSAGVVVAGEHRVEVERTSVSGAGQCGVCFLGRSDGLVQASTLLDNVVGVVSAGSSRPAVTGTTIRGGEVSVQVGEQGAPVLEGNELVGAARAAVIAEDSARGRLDGNRCAEVPVGVVVSGDAVPFVGDNDGCAVVRGQ